METQASFVSYLLHQTDAWLILWYTPMLYVPYWQALSGSSLLTQHTDKLYSLEILSPWVTDGRIRDINYDSYITSGPEALISSNGPDQPFEVLHPHPTSLRHRFICLGPLVPPELCWRSACLVLKPVPCASRPQLMGWLPSLTLDLVLSLWRFLAITGPDPDLHIDFLAWL